MKNIFLGFACIILFTPYTFSMYQGKLELYVRSWNRKVQEQEQNGLKELEKKQASPEEIKKFHEEIMAQKNVIQKISWDK